MAATEIGKDPGNRIRLVGGLNRFAFRLFRQLCQEQPEGNLFLSPSSIATALAIAHLGAAGETREELAGLLGYVLSEEQRRAAFRDLAAATQTGGVDFYSANRVWGQASYHFHDEFVTAVQQDFGAGFAEVDFANEAERARHAINAWVAEETYNRIQDLIAPGSLEAMTRMVITNAVYFLGTWDSPFEKEDTREADFFGPGEASRVAMMHQRGQFKYSETEQFQMLELRYKAESFDIGGDAEHGTGQFVRPTRIPGNNFAMNVLLPTPRSSLEELTTMLTEKGLPSFPAYTEHEVQVYLPKFRVEGSFSLAETLQKLGLARTFTKDADFSAMSADPEGLYVSQVVHRAFVDVNEKGTEAAAATAISMAGGGKFVEPKRVEFRAERPFVFLIRDTLTGLVHFIGRLEQPATD